MKAKELREMPKEELISKREDIRSEMFNLRFRATSSQNTNPMRIRLLRRDIARIETVLNETDKTSAKESKDIGGDLTITSK